jgi:hypothetical protein
MIAAHVILTYKCIWQCEICCSKIKYGVEQKLFTNETPVQHSHGGRATGGFVGSILAVQCCVKQ